MIYYEKMSLQSPPDMTNQMFAKMNIVEDFYTMWTWKFEQHKGTFAGEINISTVSNISTVENFFKKSLI